MKHVFTFLCLLPIWVGLSASVFGQDRLVTIRKVTGQKNLVYTYAKATASPTAAAARTTTDCPLNLITDPPATSGQVACAGSLLPDLLVSGIQTSAQGNCGLNTTGPITIELSDGSGTFTNSTPLATSPNAIDAIDRILRFPGYPTVSLPADLPAGSNYKIRFRVTSTGVISNESLSFTINPLPTAYSVTGGGTLCQNDPGVAVGLSSSQTGVRYRLLLNNNAVGSLVVGTGSVISFGNQTSAGTYTVQATTTTGSCQRIMTGSASVSVNTPPTVSITPSATAICQGQSTTFTATPGLTSYRWGGPGGTPVLTTASISASIAGTYSLTVTNSNSCSATATASLTVNALPTLATVTQASPVCAGQPASIRLTGLPEDAVLQVSYRINGVDQPLVSIITSNARMGWLPADPIPFQTRPLTTADNGMALTITRLTIVGSGCSQMFNSSLNLSVNPSFTANLTNNGPLTCARTSVILTATGGPTDATYMYSSGAQATSASSATASVTQAGPYSVTVTSPEGCSATAITSVMSTTTAPDAPAITTQAGQSYPAGVSSLTISQNTGNVVLMVSGCPGGTINWNGGNALTLAVSTMNTGVQTFTATCTNTTTGCTSPVATATVTVVAPSLKVFSRDPDNGQLGNNTLKPYLLLQNVGTTPIPYSAITVRYYITTEPDIPLIFQKNYVAIGQNNVSVRYVPLATPRQGATGYIEYSFTAGAGSLAPGSNSGPIEIQVNKQDYSAFNQLDDYSYVNNSAFMLNPRITAYENGVIFYGQEPGAVGASPRQGVAEAASGLQVRVLGNPVSGQQAQLEISGVAGQGVQVELTDLQGRLVHQQRIEQAGAVERVSVPMGSATGILLLQVKTATQRQQIKLVKQ